MIKWFKKHFIPHEHNEYRPHFLRHESILIIGFLVIVIELAFLVQVFVILDQNKFLAAVLPGVLTELTNEERGDSNLPPLGQNALLVQAAQLKAEDMAQKGYFSHNSPDGKTPWYWLGQVGYNYQSAGENLAVNFFESNDVVKAWMNSPTHRANIVKTSYTEMGIGVASGTYQGRPAIFVAQFFGNPISFTYNSKPEASTQIAQTEDPEPILALQENQEVIETQEQEPEPTTLGNQAETNLRKVSSNLTPVFTTVLGEEAVVGVGSVVEKDGSRGIGYTIGNLLSSPIKSTTYFYAFIAFLIMIALLLLLFVRSELSHPKTIAKGFALLSVIVLLLLVNFKVFYSETLVPAETFEVLNATVIESFAP